MRRKKFALSGIWKDSRKKFHWNVLLKFVLEKYLSAVLLFCCHQSHAKMIVHHNSEQIDSFGSHS